MTRRVNSDLGSYLCLTIAMLIVGSSVVASKIVVDTMPIYTASTIRFLLAAAILLAAVRRAGGIPRLSLRVHGVIALQALTGLVGFNVLLLFGLDRTTAMASGIITSCTPAVIAVLSVALGDRLRLAGWLGVVLAMAGIAIVNVLGTDDVAGASEPVLGATLVFLAVVGEAAYTVLGKIAAPSLRPVPMATLVTLYGALLFLPLAVLDVALFHPGEIPIRGWLAIIYLASVVTVVAFALFFTGLRRVPASTAGAFTGFMPVGTLLATAIFLAEPVTWLHVAGVGVAIAGIVLVTRGMRQASTTAVPGPTSSMSNR